MSSKRVTHLIQTNKFTFSFEVTPDISVGDINNLKVNPVFFSVTWHAKSHQCENLDIGPLRMAKLLKSKGKEVLMHFSCGMLRKEYVNQVLAVLKENNICNIFIIFGENYDAAKSDFQSSRELISYVRKNTGEYFCIGVAGSPDHSGDKLQALKEKIDSGADFIITQAFFEVGVFNNFVKSCREIGISAPIIPGVFLFENFKQLNGFINVCKVKVSQEVLDQVKNKEESAIPGSDIVKKLLRDLMTDTKLKHFHFFTLNKLDLVSKFVNEF